MVIYLSIHLSINATHRFSILDLPGPLVAPVAAYLVRHIHGTQVYSIHICTPPNPPALFLLSTKETGPTITPLVLPNIHLPYRFLHTFRRHTDLTIFIARFRAYLPPANKRLIAGTPTRRTLTSDREFTTYICVLAATRMRPRDFLLFRRSASGYSFRPVPSIFFLFPADPASAHGGLGNGAAMQTLLPVDTSRRRPQVRYHPFHLMGLGTRVSWSNRNFTGRNSLN